VARQPASDMQIEFLVADCTRWTAE